jgi:CHAD domain-containing protein
MVRATHSAHPIQVLRDATTALEASILLCVADPKKSAVHLLRTTTRRIEAQLALLSMLPGLPPHDQQQRKVLRLLKKIRRSAGKVRDIDVQRDLIRDQAAGSKGARPDHDIRAEARRLRRKLKHKREQEAGHLLRLLHKQHVRLPVVFAKLLDALAPADSITLSEANLTALVRDWYHHPGDRQHSDSAPQDTADFHAIRKRAKLARYLAESAPESASAAGQLAAKFEKLQQAGGKWHDWLLLAEVSASELGDSAKLSQIFSAKANRALETFKRRLHHKM